MGTLLTLLLLVLAFWEGYRTGCRIEGHDLSRDEAVRQIFVDIQKGVCWLVLKAHALVKRACQKICSWFEEHQRPD